MDEHDRPPLGHVREDRRIPYTKWRLVKHALDSAEDNLMTDPDDFALVVKLREVKAVVQERMDLERVVSGTSLTLREYRGEHR